MMVSRALSILSVALLGVLSLPACGGDDDSDEEGGACSKNGPTGDSHETISVGGKDRTFTVHVPTSAATKSVALVFAFHGDGGTGEGLQKSIKLEAETLDSAIVVYPDADGGSFDTDTQQNNKDVALFDAIVAKYEDSHCITKVFAMGFSRGAYFTNHLACYRGSKLRAIAAHSGGGPYSAPYANAQLQCPDTPTASLVIHGLADNEVKITEADKTIAQWTRTLACGTGTSPVDPSPCVEYDGCRKPLQVCKIEGLGHAVWDQGVKTSWSFFMDQ